MTRSPGLVLTALLTALTAALQVEAEMGIAYTDRPLPTLDGEPMSIGQFRGRRLLLIDFASW